MNPEAMFAEVVTAIVTETDGPGTVEPPVPGRRRFGSEALKVDGKIFAMLRDGRLVLKLPPDRVAALIEAGAGVPFTAGKSRPMRGWVMVDPDGGDWIGLARAARGWVATQT